MWLLFVVGPESDCASLTRESSSANRPHQSVQMHCTLHPLHPAVMSTVSNSSAGNPWVSSPCSQCLTAPVSCAGMQAVVGSTLHMGARVAWGLGVILFAALDLWLLQLSHLQLGWRQHSKLPCDPRRKHAAQQQQLYEARTRYTCLASSCMHILVLSMVNGLVLALSEGRADMAGKSVLTAAAGDPAGQTQAAMQTAKTGVLVAVGFTLLPALWLAASRCAVHFRSKNIELLATATLAIAELLPVSAPTGSTRYPTTATTT